MSGLWTIVLAGGRGSRFTIGNGTDGMPTAGLRPKQFLDLGGRSLAAASTLAAASVADGVVVVLPERDMTWDRPALSIPLIEAGGGADRAASVRAGLVHVPQDCGIVIIADAAHPLASPELFGRVVNAIEAGADAAVPGLPLTEALIRVGDDGARIGGLPREGHALVQMPHAFRAAILRRVHANSPAAVEDSQLVAAAGGRVVVVAGEPSNLHVTTPAELAMVRCLHNASPKV